MKRIATIDFVRGFAIFGVCFVHFFSDLFDADSALSNINSLPLSLVLILLIIVYLGTWGGLFVMISAAGNMFSMQANLEKGVSPKLVAEKQIVSGIILLAISMLVEGVLQRYGYLGFLVPVWGPPQPTRWFWHMFTMTPVHCLSICMIINGLLHGLLSQNKGFKEYKRNIMIYLILGIISIAVTQIIWNFTDSIIPGYPAARYPAELGLVSDYYVDKPLMGLSWWLYFQYFGLLLIGGANTPLFPFLFTSFVGNAIGLALVAERENIVEKEKRTSHFCLKGSLLGLLVLLSGVIVGVIVGAGFDEFLPLTNSFGNITDISEGQNWLWYPWFAFQTGGQIIFIFLMLRAVEFRGKTKKFADKTTFIRRFGMPAFTIYAFHRYIGLVGVTFMAWISGNDYTLDSKSLPFGYALLNVAVAILCVHAVMLLWEKLGYVGSLEWIMGVLVTSAFPTIPRSKSAAAELKMEDPKEKISRKALLGPMNIQKLFYEPEWETEFEETEIKKVITGELRICIWFGVFGILILPLSIASFLVMRKIDPTNFDERNEKKAKKVKILCYICFFLSLAFWITLSFLNLSILGISF